MSSYRFHLIVPIVLVSLSALGGAAPSRPALTFEQRAEAQRAIERVRYRHQIDARMPFEQAVPTALLERKVTTSMEQSAALDRIPGRAITDTMLQAELRRMTRRTRMPERLEELFAALDHDPYLIQECLVRPVLAERLSRASRAIQSDGFPDGKLLVEPESVSSTASFCADEAWENQSLDDPTGLPPYRARGTAVWTGEEMIVWGGDHNEVPGQGVAYNPATDTWRMLSTVSAPRGAEEHTAVWTGTEMIVWGGLSYAYPDPTSSGGRYNPATDTWVQVSAPGALFDHVAVWTGSRMIVHGGRTRDPFGQFYVTVGSTLSYDPTTDVWTSLAGSTPRYNHAAVWTGDRMVVWSGSSSSDSYDPVTNVWSPLPSMGAPSAAIGYHVLWTGSHVIVWGGAVAEGGALFDPVAGSWSPIALTGAPAPVDGDSAVWTGSEMIVWGGGASGSRYDPVTNTWMPVSSSGAPAPRYGHSAVWSGSEMIVLFGSDGEAQRSWARYRPDMDQWITPQLSGAPAARDWPTTLWTGNVVIVWGGYNVLFRGSRYDPVLDAWSPMTVQGAPAWRRDYRAVWAGSSMVVWGGYVEHGQELDTGGRYDPIADAWSATSLIGAPSRRTAHSMIWTGTEVIVWGGYTLSESCLPCVYTYHDTGGRYDPVADSWTPTSTLGAPPPQSGHAAAWVDGRMVIWGGPTVGGGRYNPAIDQWLTMSLSNAPPKGYVALPVDSLMLVWGPGSTVGVGATYSPAADAWTPIPAGPANRYEHAAVSTGREMILWGGRTSYSSYFPTGWRFRPSTNTWTEMTASGSPAPRTAPGAVWLGDRMFVWGGTVDSGERESGGIYRLFPLADNDQDAWCVDQDCDDSSSAVYPGAPEVCDGLNNDCNDPGWPSLTGIEADDDGDSSSECAGDCNDAQGSVYPGAPQLCLDGQNNDCDDPSWPALIGTNEVDGDGDGLSACQGDCDDAHRDWWRLPGDVRELVAGTDGGLTWMPPLDPGGYNLTYDVLRANDRPAQFASGACLESGGPDATALDTQTPLPGHAFLYVVRALNGCGAGPACIGSNGQELPAATCE